VDLLTEPSTITPAVLPGADPLPGQLADLVAGIAADPGRWRPLVQPDRPGGWWVPLPRTAGIEVALVGWAPGQATTAHDHGGAAGAWAVLEGELVEDHFHDLSWSARPRRTRVGPGRTVESGPDHVHVVANPGPGWALTIQAHTPHRRAARLPLVGAASILAEAAPWRLPRPIPASGV
jgi:hypothetical protein